MTNQTEETRKPSGSPKARGDRFEIVKFLLIAMVCFGLGFGLVYVFLGPPVQEETPAVPISPSPRPQTVEETGTQPDPDPQAEPAPAAAPKTPGESSRYAPDGAGPGYDIGAQAASAYGASATPPAPASIAPPVDPNAIGQPVPPPSNEPAVDRGALPPVVPPGKTPEGMAVDGDAFYLKCWDNAGTELKGESCDKLELFEKRFATRLYVVDKCRLEKAGSEASGKLSLGVEVDFSALSVSFWNGPSSDLPSADAVARCLKTELRGLPVDGVPHKHAKYRMFFTVLFGKKAMKAAADKPPQPSAKAIETTGGQSKPATVRKGKTVKVVKDRVRVRKTPVDGEEIGKIGAGNDVQLIGRKGEWCQVVTPAGNEGWMICDALAL